MKRIVQKLVSLLALLSVEVLLLWGTFLFLLLLFLLIANEVFVQQDSVFDNTVFRFAESHTTQQLTRFMKIISFFASVEYLMVMPPLLVLLLSFFRDLRWYGLKVLVISFSSSVLNQALKHFFERPRPEFAMLQQSGHSFPSGHAMIGGAFYGLLIYIVWRTVRVKSLRWALAVLLTLLILLIGYSRVYLKVHYATDVLAGYALGFLWLMLSVYFMRRLEKVYVTRFERKV